MAPRCARATAGPEAGRPAAALLAALLAAVSAAAGADEYPLVAPLAGDVQLADPAVLIDALPTAVEFAERVTDTYAREYETVFGAGSSGMPSAAASVRRAAAEYMCAHSAAADEPGDSWISAARWQAADALARFWQHLRANLTTAYVQAGCWSPDGKEKPCQRQLVVLALGIFVGAPECAVELLRVAGNEGDEDSGGDQPKLATEYCRIDLLESGADAVGGGETAVYATNRSTDERLPNVRPTHLAFDHALDARLVGTNVPVLRVQPPQADLEVATAMGCLAVHPMLTLASLGIGLKYVKEPSIGPDPSDSPPPSPSPRPPPLPPLPPPSPPPDVIPPRLQLAFASARSYTASSSAVLLVAASEPLATVGLLAALHVVNGSAVRAAETTTSYYDESSGMTEELAEGFALGWDVEVLLDSGTTVSVDVPVGAIVDPAGNANQVASNTATLRQYVAMGEAEVAATISAAAATTVALSVGTSVVTSVGSSVVASAAASSATAALGTSSIGLSSALGSAVSVIGAVQTLALSASLAIELPPMYQLATDSVQWAILAQPAGSTLESGAVVATETAAGRRRLVEAGFRSSGVSNVTGTADGALDSLVLSLSSLSTRDELRLVGLGALGIVVGLTPLHMCALAAWRRLLKADPPRVMALGRIEMMAVAGALVPITNKAAMLAASGVSSDAAVGAGVLGLVGIILCCLLYVIVVNLVLEDTRAVVFVRKVDDGKTALAPLKKTPLRRISTFFAGRIDGSPADYEWRVADERRGKYFHR